MTNTASGGTWYPRAHIIVYSEDDKLILESDTGYLTYSVSSYGGSALNLEDKMYYDLTKDTSR